jgi:hypothetical protein
VVAGATDAGNGRSSTATFNVERLPGENDAESRRSSYPVVVPITTLVPLTSLARRSRGRRRSQLLPLPMLDSALPLREK